MEQHKHKGMERDNGNLRLHPVSQVHKDKNVQRWHNESLKKTTSKPKEKIQNLKTFFKKEEVKSQLDSFNRKKKVIDDQVQDDVKAPSITAQTFPVDDEGYICLDLDTSDATGLRLMFTRTERRNGRDVKSVANLQFENAPARDCRSGERLTGGRISLNKKY